MGGIRKWRCQLLWVRVPVPGTRTCEHTFPVWTSDNFERLPLPASQREQGLPNLKPKHRSLLQG